MGGGEVSGSPAGSRLSPEGKRERNYPYKKEKNARVRPLAYFLSEMTRRRTCRGGSGKLTKGEIDKFGLPVILGASI